MIKRDRIYQTIFAYVFILPAFILLGIFLFYPTIYSLILSLFNYNIISPPTFVGLKNFQKVFSDRDFWEALGRSITYLLVVPPIQFVSILMAILVNRELRGISFFRLSYYIPVVTSTVAVAVVWKWIYDGDYGLLNAILSLLGLIGEGKIFPSRPLWLSDPSLVLPSVMFVTFWKGLGFYMMIYLASLKNIPVELEESALIDGANRWQVLFKITIPMLRPTILFCSVISSMSALRVFDEVYVMAGSQKAATTASIYIYNTTFGGGFSFGYAASMGLILALVSMLFVFINIKVFRKGGIEQY